MLKVETNKGHAVTIELSNMLSTVELLPKVLLTVLWTTCFPNSVSAAASASAASAVCIYYVVIGGALRAPLVHDEIRTAAAAEAEAAAEKELGKHVVHIRTFGKSSYVDDTFC